MRSPWKFISSLAARRREREGLVDEDQAQPNSAPVLLSPPVEEDKGGHGVTNEPTEAKVDTSVEHVPAGAALQALDEQALDEPVLESSDAREQDATDTPAPASPEPQSAEPESPVTEVAIEDDVREPLEVSEPATVAEPVTIEPAVSEAVASEIKGIEAFNGDHPSPAAIDTASVTDILQEIVEEVPSLSPSQRFQLEMQAVDADIAALRHALSEKLRSQNIQLRAMLDRYPAD
jgi:hypothetical protein